jgi:hypothetical protein
MRTPGQAMPAINLCGTIGKALPKHIRGYTIESIAVPLSAAISVSDGMLMSDLLYFQGGNLVKRVEPVSTLLFLLKPTTVH